MFQYYFQIEAIVRANPDKFPVMIDCSVTDFP